MAGLAGLAGCTKNNADGSGSGGDSEDKDSSDDGSNKPSETIDTAGSSAVFPLATAMIEHFQIEHSEVDTNLQSTGPGSGFANYLRTGQTDFSNASHPIKDEEQDRCENNGMTLVELRVATDALMVIVNNDDGFLGEGLIVEQFQTIFSAEPTPTTWSDVNSEWPDEGIGVYGPTNTSGTYDYPIKAIIGGEGPGHRQDHSATEQDRTIIQSVRGPECAIGYLGFMYYSENTDTVQAVPTKNDVGEFVEPLLGTALSGEYNPPSCPLFTYPVRESLVKERAVGFARYWIRNSTSCEIVADKIGYVPLDEDDQQEMLDTLDAAIEEAN